MRFWFDTEFIEDGKTIELLSIGIVAEDGREYYAEPKETDRSRACDWVKANVIPRLSTGVFLRPRTQIAQEITAFAGDKPQFWAYFGAYDWVALCRLYGRLVDLPKGWPMWCRDLRQLREFCGNPRLPAKPDNLHNALADARWTRDAWRSLIELQQAA